MQKKIDINRLSKTEIGSFRHFTFIIILLFVCISSVGASGADTITSVYKEGKFETRFQSLTKASDEIAQNVADYLVADFHNSPGHLFTWALKGLGLQNKNNELIIVFKSSEHDTKTGITHGVFDIVVPGITTFSNIKVDAIVSKTKYTSGVIKVTANIIYSSLLLKNAIGTLLLVPQKNNELSLITNVSINFGWFFNLFITQKRYKSIVEWRIKKFNENIIDECERRQRIEAAN
ncbi:MAG: hypothetical protein QM800_13305 [Paludibacter sp.]